MEKHEFNMYPEMNEEQYDELKKSIEKGYDDLFPIILYQNKILDGWNRYRICKKLGIAFLTKNFEGGDLEALYFVVKSNNRRDLEPSQRGAIALEYLPLFEEKAKEKQVEAGKMYGENHPKEVSDSSHEPLKIRSGDQAGEMFGVSGRTVERIKKVKKESPELFEKIKAGKETAVGAEKIIKQEKREKEIKQQREAIEKGEVKLPEGLFENIAIDPPWPYGTQYDSDNRRIASPYPEMSIDELASMKLPATKDATLWLWTTHRFLPDAFELMNHWGFTYKATIVWDKVKLGMGAWVRMQAEFCLLGIKGKPTWDLKNQRDIITEARQEHSRKPEAFYKMVEELTIGRRLDFFSREKREGWEQFGNDPEKFIDQTKLSF